ncbi:DUF4241 domain-containing protein [Streptomyces sp. NPDC055239]
MIFDSLDVSYGEMWGSYRGMTHPDPMSRALAARKHAAGVDYAVLLSARERPLALVEYWPRRMWRVYLFDDRSWRMQMIDLKPHSTGMLLAHRNIRWQFSSEQDHSYGKWDVQETTTVSADGQVEVRSEFAGPREASTEPLHARTSGPSSVPVRRFAAPVESFLCPVPEFGDWQVFAPFLAQQGHEPATAVTFLDIPPREWEMALRPDEDLGLLGEGQFYGVGVDTGTVAFMDAARTVIEDQLDEDLFIPLDRHFTVELASTEPEPNLITFRAGQGDGAYPVWIGRTDAGQVGCVVVDFQLHSADAGEARQLDHQLRPGGRLPGGRQGSSPAVLRIDVAVPYNG